MSLSLQQSRKWELLCCKECDAQEEPEVFSDSETESEKKPLSSTLL